MKKYIFIIALIFLGNTVIYSQNQTYTTGTNVYTFNTVGSFQLTGIPAGKVVQIECYGAGGGGGGVWTNDYSSTSSGGGGGGGYAKLNYFTVSGGTLAINVGKGGLKGTGSIPLAIAYDGKDGGYSAVYAPSLADTICKASGGKGSLHAFAEHGVLFNPEKDVTVGGIGGSGLIGDVLLSGGTGTTGTAETFGNSTGGDGGNGAGPLGGDGGLYANSVVANYGVDGSPYGGGGSGCADYEGSGGKTYKIGGDGADGGVIITILDISITTQPITTSTYCAGETISVDYTITGTFNSGNTFEIQLSDASGSFSSPTVIGSVSSTTSGTITGTIPSGTTTGTGYRVRVVSSDPSINGTDNGTDLVIQSIPAAPSANDQAFCDAASVADLLPNSATNYWYTTATGGTNLNSSQPLSSQTYYVSTKLNGCESDRTAIQVDIHSTPSVNAGSDQTVCEGTDVTLTASNPNGATISWDNAITDGTAFTPTVGTTTYTVTATSNGCSASDQVDVTVNAAPSFSVAGTNPTQCTNPDGEIVLSGLTPSETYSVAYNGGASSSMNADASGNIVISGLNSGNYTQFVVENTSLCATTNNSSIDLVAPASPTLTINNVTICAGSQDTLYAIGSPAGGTYSWTTSAGLTPINDSTAVVNPTSSQNYSIAYSYTGCGSSASATVTVHALPSVNAGSDQTVCPEETITLTASGANSYSWNNGQFTTTSVDITTNQDTTIYLEGTDQFGCTNSDTINISIQPHPIALAGDTLPSICKKGTSIVMNGSIGGAATSGYWIGGNGTWNNASDPSQATYIASMSDMGWITLKLIATGGACPNDTAYNYIEIRDCVAETQDENLQLIQIYPNPSHSYFVIKGSNLAKNFNTYKLVSITGQIIQTGKITHTIKKVALKNITPGIYFVHLIGKRKQVLKIEVR